MRYDDPQLQDQLAAAYVLGTLAGAARRRFEDLATRDPQLRARVDRWQERLSPLALALPPIEPSPRVWERVRERLFAERAATRWGFAFWRGWAIAATLTCVALAVTLLRPGEPLGPAQETLAVLQDAQARPAFLVSYAPDGRTLALRRLQVAAAPTDRSLELWLLPASGAAPQSLGVLRDPDRPVLQVSERYTPAALLAGRLAISLEPRGGSPTGQPTGPVLYQGAWSGTRS